MLNQPIAWLLLIGLGIFTGAVAGVLGIGGGLLIVPVLSIAGLSLVQATATSLVGVFLSAVSGSVRNWQAGELNLTYALGLAIFGIPTAQLGAWLADRLPEAWLAFGFAGLMLVTIYFMYLKQTLKQAEATILEADPPSRRTLPVIGIGLLAGLLSGLFGIGGGAVMVPLQMLLLGESIKAAVRTSLGAIVLISASGLAQHSWNGNVLWIPGLCLGLGGMLGAQFGTRLLPRLPDQTVNVLFRLLLIGLAIYMVWKGIYTWK